MHFLAHRGLWTKQSQRNTRAALCDAFSLGFGVETDVRDRNGALVISHDMATEQSISLSTMLDDYDAAGRPGHLALNIKADGLADELLKVLDKFESMRSHVFVFDMSIPDTLKYLGHHGLRVFTRCSEYEIIPPLELQTQGVWMDCFVNLWVNPKDIVHRLSKGQQVAVVSPELHQRDVHMLYWQILKDGLEASIVSSDTVKRNLMLCTDFPIEAQEFFMKDGL